MKPEYSDIKQNCQICDLFIWYEVKKKNLDKHILIGVLIPQFLPGDV